MLTVGDGIARVRPGRARWRASSREFPNQLMGIVLNLEEDNVGVAVSASDTANARATSSSRTGRIADVPVGEALAGRVVNALGFPIDGKGPDREQAPPPHRDQGPGIVARQTVNEPLQTGLKAIDG